MLTKIKVHNFRRAATIFINIAVLCCWLLCCKQKHADKKVERSFYYWKSVYKLTDFEKSRLDSLKIKTIYLKFFDVGWDEHAQKPLPKAIIRINDSACLQLRQVIPTVFITNECIQKIDPAQINLLADKMVALIKNIFSNSLAGRTIQEVQIDCDWSASTKDKYFSLLTAIKKSGIATLSATIRLHQVKYVSATGVPPVEKGLLMCYNMGNLKDPASKNSIMEAAELKKYIMNLTTYPLPLDVALPLFDWFVLFRNNQYLGLVRTLDILNPAIEKLTAGRYFILSDTIINGVVLKKRRCIAPGEK